MAVRAKFKCQSVGVSHQGKALRKDEKGNYAKDEAGKYIEEGDVYHDVVVMSPVYGDANKPWSEYTPAGRLELSITNPALHGHFKPGKEYYLDITEAE